MKRKLKRFLSPVLFILAGAMVGFVYYRFIGCGGSCPIASSPIRSMAYMGLAGWLLSNVFSKGSDGRCNM